MTQTSNPDVNPADKRAAALRRNLARGGSVRVTAFGHVQRRDASGRVVGNYASDVLAIALVEGWLVEASRRKSGVGEVVEYRLVEVADPAPAPRTPSPKRATRRTVARPAQKPPAAKKPKPAAAKKPAAKTPRKVRRSRVTVHYPATPQPLADGTECITRDDAVARWGCSISALRSAVQNRRVDCGSGYRPPGARGVAQIPIALTPKTLAYAESVWLRSTATPGTPRVRIGRFGPPLPESPNPLACGAESLTIEATVDRFGTTVAAVQQALYKGRVDRGGPWRSAGTKGLPRPSIALTARTLTYAQAVWVEGRKPRNPPEQQIPSTVSKKVLPSSPPDMPDGTPCETLPVLSERYGRAHATVLYAINDGHVDRGTTYRPDGTTGRGLTSVAMTERSIAWMESSWRNRRVEMEQGAWLMQRDLADALGYAKPNKRMLAKLSAVPQRRRGGARLYLVGDALVEAALALRIDVELIPSVAASPASEVAEA